MQIIDFAYQPENTVKNSNRPLLDAITAALIFIVPALLLFVLSIK